MVSIGNSLVANLLGTSKASALRSYTLSDDEKRKFASIATLGAADQKGVADNSEGNLYATVEVAGRVVAKVYNGGLAEVSDSSVNALSGGLSWNGSGPLLAQKRAAEIAAALGGTVTLSSTAQNQSQWLEKMSGSGTSSTSSTLVTAQMIAQGSTGAGETTTAAATPEDSSSSTIQDILKKGLVKYAEEQAEKAMRKKILERMGLTEESLASMDPKDRAQIEKLITAAIQAEAKEKLKEQVKKEDPSLAAYLG